MVNGGHNLICEALHFGKPVLCFPIARLFEQFINAWHVRALGYGDFSTDPRPGMAIFAAFERRLDDYRAAIAAAGSFDGTARVVARRAGDHRRSMSSSAGKRTFGRLAAPSSAARWPTGREDHGA